jgi:formate hydrogenlyase transcriptional activator
VLILGETGTGKELIARAIHNHSPRANKLLVKVNCAALPANLIESELFGHEKGSFTGATERRIGKFELANGGSLFLDEIGEMPLELQVKLLRALQEREIERVGGKGVIRVDVRIIAATNRKLEEEVREGRFRTDLYFRISTFPIHLPALRHRKSDIPLLATYFAERFAKKSGKAIDTISQRAIQDLMLYHWPGNIRELEHQIERSVLLTQGHTIKLIQLPVAATNSQNENGAEKAEWEMPIRTIDEHERELIIRTLRHCGGKVSGANGAAALLGVPSTTLNAKIKRLGIRKNFMR